MNNYQQNVAVEVEEGVAAVVVVTSPGCCLSIYPARKISIDGVRAGHANTGVAMS